MNINVRIFKNGLESSMAHCISQNLIKDANFDVEWYLNECRSLFLSLDIKSSLVDVMIDEARNRGLMEYVTGLTIEGVDAAAQMHPSANPILVNGAERLSALLKQYMPSEVSQRV